MMTMNWQLLLGAMSGVQTLALAIWAYRQRVKTEEKVAVQNQIGELKADRSKCALECERGADELWDKVEHLDRRLSHQEGMMQQVTRDLDNIRDSMTQMGAQVNFVATNTLTKADIPLLVASMSNRH